MTTPNKTGRPRNSKTANTTKKSPPRWGWVTRDYLSYAFVWFAGLAVGAWLF